MRPSVRPLPPPPLTEQSKAVAEIARLSRQSWRYDAKVQVQAEAEAEAEEEDFHNEIKTWEKERLLFPFRVSVCVYLVKWQERKEKKKKHLTAATIERERKKGHSRDTQNGINFLLFISGERKKERKESGGSGGGGAVVVVIVGGPQQQHPLDPIPSVAVLLLLLLLLPC